jgi:hypothetical protein
MNEPITLGADFARALAAIGWMRVVCSGFRPIE